MERPKYIYNCNISHSFPGEHLPTGTLSDRHSVTFTLHRSETLTNHGKIISGEWEIHIYLSITAKAQLKSSDRGPKHEAGIRSTPGTRVVFGELCRGVGGYINGLTARLVNNFSHNCEFNYGFDLTDLLFL